jgi:hypothetical protein
MCIPRMVLQMVMRTLVMRTNLPPSAWVHAVLHAAMLISSEAHRHPILFYATASDWVRAKHLVLTRIWVCYLCAYYAATAY